ncbi:MAG: FliH/SctL family protein [Bacteroidota bacterium]
MSNILRLNSKPKLNVKNSSSLNTFTQEEETISVIKQIEDAYNKGFKEGQLKLKLELDKEYTDKLYKKYEEVYHVLEAYDQKIEEYEQGFEKLVIHTAFELAKKIVQRDVVDNTIINETVSRAITKVIGANEVRIKMHPVDVEQIDANSRNLINSSSFNKIKFEGDERIEIGGCLIETEIGNVDARISTQLEELRRKLEESIENKKPS